MAVDVPRTPLEFVEWLVARHPELDLILADHISDNDELLPHLFLGDVTRFAADLARRAEAETGADAELVALLRDLDAAIPSPGPDGSVENLVGVSFVENASTDDDEPLRGRLRGFANLARALGDFA